MVQVTSTEVDSHQVNSFYPIRRVVGAGLIAGILFWVLTAIINNYAKNIVVSGNVATIITATLAVVLMLQYRITQPLIVAVASAIILWGLASWTDGLSWGEALAWSVILYVIAYLFFSWIIRYKRGAPVLVAMIIVIALARIAISS